MDKATILIASFVIGAMVLIVALTGSKLSLPGGIRIGSDRELSCSGRVAVGAVGIIMICVPGFFAVSSLLGLHNSENSKTIRLSDGLDRFTTDKECQPLNGGNIQLGGRLTASDFVQCSESGPAGQAHNYVFAVPPLPDGTYVQSVLGTFGIDEAGDVDQSGAYALWTVKYGRLILCQVQAEWQRPSHCKDQAPKVLINGGEISVTQSLYAKNPNEKRPVFAGVMGLAIQLREP